MSALKLERNTISWVVDHLLEWGDTDIFPYPAEFQFLKDSRDEIATALSEINLRTYHPVSYVESLFPKSKYGFRVAHQLFPVDAILFTGAVVEIADQVEESRTTKPPKYQLNSSYSYRFQPDEDSFALFDSEYKYQDWLECLTVNSTFSTEYTHVIVTDVSDFYHRIYRHRLENCLNTYTSDSPFVKFIEKCMNDWRGRQSFGIPVGGNACRILAEAALCDTDQALLAEGYDFTRYVDDMAIFIKPDQDSYTALAFLAEHLAVNEGLSLNTKKTQIYKIDEYASNSERQSGEDIEQAEEASIEMLYYAAYGHDDDIDEEALAELQAKDLLPYLKEEMEKDYWEVGRIRILLRAIRLTKSRTASHFIRDNIGGMLAFAKDVVLVIEELKKDGDNSFDDLAPIVIELLLSDTLRSLTATRAWLFELFTRNVLPITQQQIRQLSGLTGTLDKRYLHMLRSSKEDVNHFRRNKTRINEMSPWEQPAFIKAANCLPKDEYVHWVRSIKSRLNFPLAIEYCDWCMKTA